MKIGNIKTPYGEASINVGRYPAGGAIYVQLICEDGEPLGTFSTNLVPYGGKVEKDEFFVKAWAENQQLVEPMLGSGLFVDTGKVMDYEFVQAPVWKLVNHAHVPM